MNLIQWLKKKHIFHSWEEIGEQHVKGILCGSSGCELPVQRVVYKCSRCGEIKHVYLNLSTPYKLRRDDSRWSPHFDRLIEQKYGVKFDSALFTKEA